MVVTLFDLDHTLLPLDTNQSWVAFLCDIGALEEAYYLPRAAAMKKRYLQGGDDPDVEFCEFFIGTLLEFANIDLERLRRRFIDEVIMPAIQPSAKKLVTDHKEAGDACVMITATNRFITEPIAPLFGIEHLIATECEADAAGFTGHVKGIPSMRSGKVMRFHDWLASGALPGVKQRSDIKTLRFYSDSINDRALLEAVDVPVAVNADAALLELARLRHWPELKLD
jgi:HAD superfamily hydrolase (TIGR01490 family)